MQSGVLFGDGLDGGEGLRVGFAAPAWRDAGAANLLRQILVGPQRVTDDTQPVDGVGQ